MFDLFGSELPLAARFFIAFLVVLALIGLTAWVVRRFGANRLGGARCARAPAAARGDRRGERRRPAAPGADPPRQYRTSADDRRPHRRGDRAQYRARHRRAGNAARRHARGDARTGAACGRARAVDATRRERGNRLAVAAGERAAAGGSAASLSRPGERRALAAAGTGRPPAPGRQPHRACRGALHQTDAAGARGTAGRAARAAPRHRRPRRPNRHQQPAPITTSPKWRSSSKPPCAVRRCRKAGRR